MQLYDVHGKHVVPFFAPLASADEAGTAHSTWRGVLECGVPADATPAEARQWRQEINELMSVDIAADDYRQRYIEMRTERGGRTPVNVLLERHMTQRQLVEAGWFNLTATRILADLVAHVRSDRPHFVARSRADPALRGISASVVKQLIGASTSCPRDVALTVVSSQLASIRPAKGGGGNGGSTSAFSACSIMALDATLCRVEALPAFADPRDVAKAARVLGPTDEVGGRVLGGCKAEAAHIARRLKPRRASRAKSALLVTPDPAVVLSEATMERYQLDLSVRAEFDALLL